MTEMDLPSILMPLGVIFQALTVAFLATVVFQIGHLTGAVKSLISRVDKLESWRETAKYPRLIDVK